MKAVDAHTMREVQHTSQMAQGWHIPPCDHPIPIHDHGRNISRVANLFRKTSQQDGSRLADVVRDVNVHARSVDVALQWVLRGGIEDRDLIRRDASENSNRTANVLGNREMAESARCDATVVHRL